MRKTKIIITALCVVAVITLLGYFVYFVGGVSAVLPPIKNYEYNGDAIQLITKIKVFTILSKQPKLIFNVDEVVGNKYNGYAYETTLAIKDSNQNLLYDLKFSDVGKSKLKAKIKLIGAHNLKTNAGGYGITADGMNTLLQQLNLYIIAPLKTKGVILDISK